jgi:hypothetical protein
MKKTKYILYALASILFFSCTEENTRQIVNGSYGKPDPPTEIHPVPIAGGAIIKYRIPPNPDLLMVKAVYQLSNGKQREVSASYFVDSLIIEGLIDTQLHEVKLYAVSRALEVSDAEPVKFTPLESAFSKVIKSMKIVPDYSGANFSWINLDEELLTFDLQAANDNGAMMTANVLQSDEMIRTVSVHGFDATPRKFACNVTDKWGNESGLIYPDQGDITPMPEGKLDPKNITVMRLSSDAQWKANNGRDVNLADGDVTTYGRSLPEEWPPMVTLDLGKNYYLSRVVLFQWTFETNIYYNDVKTFEVYRCITGKPSPDGNMSEWEWMMTCRLVKPSGTPYGESTVYDIRAAKAGDNFDFPRSMAPVRYLRIRVTDTWGWQGIAIADLAFYGLIN